MCVCADEGFRYRVMYQTIEANEGYPIELSESKSDIVRNHQGGKSEKTGKGPPLEKWKKFFQILL